MEGEAGVERTESGWRARLDQPERATARVVLWLTAIILAGGLPLLQCLVQGTADGRAFSFFPGWASLLRSLALGVIAFTAGALAGAAVKGGRWAAGVGALVFAAGLQVPVLVILLPRAAVSPLGGPVQYSFHLGLQSGLFIGAMLVFAALGGAAAPVLSRRVPVHVLAGAAWAWMIVGVVRVAVFWGLFSRGVLSSYVVGSAAGFAHRGLENLPWLIGGLLLGVVVRRRLWSGVVAVVVIAALPLVSGQESFHSGPGGADVLLSITAVITRTVIGAIGVLIGAALTGVRPWREYVWPAIVVALLVAVGLMVMGVESSRPKDQEQGISAGVEPPVANGEIVLLAKGTTVGAVVLTKQGLQPERVSYEWRYRTDGKGTFRAAEAGQYRSGTVKEGSDVAFGPFFVSWSAHDGKSGYLYYPRVEPETIKADDLRICVTHERDLEKVDAFDPKWVFRASPLDVGGPLTPGARKQNGKASGGVRRLRPTIDPALPEG